MTDNDAALTLQGMIPNATTIQAEALGLGVMVLRSRGPKQEQVKRLLALLDAVSVPHAIQKLNGHGKEGTDEPTE